MKYRKLGNSGLEVSPLAFGGNVFGWTVDESKSFKLLDAFVDSGFNFLKVNPRLCRGTHSVRHFREYSDLSDSKMERSLEDLAM
jgi:hypothetical protein